MWGNWTIVLVAARAPVPRLGPAKDTSSHAADAKCAEADIFNCVIHKRWIHRIDCASYRRLMTGVDVLRASARLRIRDVYGSVKNLHVGELFAILIAVTRVPFAIGLAPFSSMRGADGVG